MQHDLLDDLVKKTQREVAGSLTASRLGYQKSWAFCQMLRRHMDQADYLVAFEFHDDVVFLTPGTSPSFAEFFQVKTSGSAALRKLSTLVSRPKQSNSILGKMWLNFQGICSSYAMRVILVSNVAFEFADSDICACDLDPKFRDKIISKLKDEIYSFSEADIDKLHFMVSGVAIDAMHSYLHGEALELFKFRFGENNGFNVHSWVRLIQSEIVRKNNYPSDKISSTDELIAKKCLGKADIDLSLALVAKKPAGPDMTLVNNELQAAGWSSQDLMRLGKCFPQATYDYADPTNEDVTKIAVAMAALFEANASLAAFIELVVAAVIATLAHPYNNKPYLAALAILVFYEEI
jgi:hypothetical protein